MDLKQVNIELEKLLSENKFAEYENLIYQELDNRNLYNHKDEIFHLGKLLCELKFNLKQYEELETILEELIRLFPAKSILAGQLAYLYSITNKKEAAEKFYTKAIEYEFPEPAVAMNYLNFLKQENRIDDLIDLGEGLLLNKFSSPEIYFLLGNIYRENHKLRKAISRYKKGLELDSQNDLVWYNLGVVYAHTDNFDKALNCYEKSIEINPENYDAHWNKALLLLTNGDFSNGWKEYEYRADKKEAFQRVVERKIWQGENLADKTILVLWEQGFGDALQFSRLLYVLKQKSAKIIFECKERLAAVMANMEFIDEIIIKGESINCSYDYCIPLMSLPSMLNISQQDLPVLNSYLSMNNKSKFDFLDQGKIKIGICWQGSKDNISDEYRSTSHRNFLRLCEIPNVQIVSLQYGLTDQEKTDFNENKIIIFEENFEKTAELISCLDIVITVDTSIAHLAGAIGTETWTLLSYNCDWRWMRHRNDSPWYPSMKLIRQNKKNNWHRVFTEIAALLWKKNLKTYKDDLQTVKLFLEFIKNLIDNSEYEFIPNLFKEFQKSKFLTPELLNIFGIALVKNGNVENGLELIEEALKSEPESINFLLNKALVLFEKGDGDKALEIFENIKNRTPDNPSLHYNMGVGKQEYGFYQEAKEDFEKAIVLKENFSEAIFNKSLIDLRNEFWISGFAGFEERRKIYSKRFRGYSIPEWTGEDLSNKSLFVYSEEGFGDIIQFSRFLFQLREKKINIGFECKPELYSLFKNTDCCDKLYNYEVDEKEILSYDYYIELLSLPSLLVKTTEDIQLKNYLDLGITKENLLDNNKLNVGIVWEGNKDFQYYSRKKCDVIELVENLKVLDVNILSMQFELSDQKIQKYFGSNSIENYIEDTEDFYDTACKLKQLDVLVTVDTAMAHLAGILNIPCFVMLHKTADWRWGKSNKTVWYKSLKLFRQNENGNWRSVFTQIKNELKELTDNKL